MYELDKLNYIYYGNGDKTVVLLHGWGQNIQMMRPIGDRISKKNKVLIVDLPGMGKSKEPNKLLTVEEYADIINKLIVKLKITNPILVGHSFGGKISIVYASKYEVQKLILLASPYCPEISKKTIKQQILTELKKVPILNGFENLAKKYIGSVDYRNASQIMREIMVASINTDFSENAKKITCPTIMIWGDKDSAVPLIRAYELEKLIKDSAVIVYPNCTHYAYLENMGQTINIINSFIGDKK